MDRNITNCIQKDLDIYGYFWYKYPNQFQIHLLFRYFYFLIHQNLTHPDAKGLNSKLTHKFIIFKKT